MTKLTRRGLLGAIIAAPAIVRASSLMAIKPFDPDAAAIQWLHARLQESISQLLNRPGPVYYSDAPLFRLAEPIRVIDLELRVQ